MLCQTHGNLLYQVDDFARALGTHRVGLVGWRMQLVMPSGHYKERRHSDVPEADLV